MQKFIIAFIVLVSVTVLVILIAVFGSSQGPAPTEAESRSIAETIIPQVPGSHHGLVTQSETNLAMTLHVDVSASMNGYVPSDSNGKSSTFLKLIEYSSRQWNARLHALSSRYPAGKDNPQSYEFFRSQTNYSGEHNMADSIRNFSKEQGRMHVLITDSQPWDDGNSPAYEKVAAAINDFLTTGGRCALILYRSPYRGFYSSPMFGSEGNNQVFYDCPNRPFAVWIFAPQGSALNQVVSDLGKQTGELAWKSKVQFGEPEWRLSLADRSFVPTGSKSSGKEIGTLTTMKTGKEIKRVREYQQIQLRKKALDDQGYVSLEFDLAPFISIDADDAKWQNLKKGLSVSIDCWEIPEKFNPGSSNALANTNLQAIPKILSPDPSRLVKRQHLELEHTLHFKTNALPENPGVTIPSRQIVTPRLIVAVPRPGAARRYAWVLTIRPKFTGTSILIPQGISTSDDRDATQCNKILMLDEMLNVVAGQTEKWGSILFITVYPKE